MKILWMLLVLLLGMVATLGFHVAGECNFLKKARLQGRRVNRRKLRRRTIRRILNSVSRMLAMAIATVCMCLPSIPIAGAERGTEREKVPCVVLEDIFTEENARTFSMLDEDVFRELNSGQKWDVLRSVMNLELAYLGCEPLDLVIYDMNDKVKAGYCSPTKGYIALNEDMLDWGSGACVKVLLHEVYHAYQYQCIVRIQKAGIDSGLKMFRDVEQWRYEFYHYCDIDENSTPEEIERYNGQMIENSADEYADRRIEEYSEYLKKFREEK